MNCVLYVLLHYVSFLVSYNVTLVNCVASQNYTKCNGTGTSRSVTLSLNLDKILPQEPTTSTPTPSPQPAPIDEIINLVRSKTCMHALSVCFVPSFTIIICRRRRTPQLDSRNILNSNRRAIALLNSRSYFK